MRCGLNLSNSAVAAGSPARMRLSDDEIQATSQSREWRLVTPLRSGPTSTPRPKVWQLLHFRVNTEAGSAAATDRVVRQAMTTKAHAVALQRTRIPGVPFR